MGRPYNNIATPRTVFHCRYCGCCLNWAVHGDSEFCNDRCEDDFVNHRRARLLSIRVATKQPRIKKIEKDNLKDSKLSEIKESKLLKIKEREAFDKDYIELYAEVKREFGCKCAGCGSESIGIHHKDGNHYNMDKGNLIPLCWPCHTLEHVNMAMMRRRGGIPAKKITIAENIKK